MSLNMRLGKRGNLLQPGPGAYTQLLLETPVLLESELEAIQTSSGLSSKVWLHYWILLHSALTSITVWTLLLELPRHQTS